MSYRVTVDELAAHRHYVSALKNNGSATHTDPGTGSDKQKFESADIATDKYEEADNPPIWNWWGRTKATGGDKPHNNIQPCEAVYIWVRAA